MSWPYLQLNRGHDRRRLVCKGAVGKGGGVGEAGSMSRLRGLHKSE